MRKWADLDQVDPQKLVDFASKQRRMGMLWCVANVRKSGLPWSHKIADRLQAFTDNCEPGIT